MTVSHPAAAAVVAVLAERRLCPVPANGGGWWAGCPACDGARLRITEESDGGLSFACDNGCEPAAIVKTLGAESGSARADSEPTTSERVIVAESFAAIRAEPTRWLWRGRIPLGAPTLLVGREKLGKSTLTCTLAASVSRGTLDGDLHGKPADVLILSYEDGARSTIMPRLLAARADRRGTPASSSRLSCSNEGLVAAQKAVEDSPTETFTAGCSAAHEEWGKAWVAYSPRLRQQDLLDRYQAVGSILSEVTLNDHPPGVIPRRFVWQAIANARATLGRFMRGDELPANAFPTSPELVGLLGKGESSGDPGGPLRAWIG